MRSVASAPLVQGDTQKATYRVVPHVAHGSASVHEAPRMANDPEAFAAAVAAR